MSTPAVWALLAYETALDGVEPTLGNRIAAMEAALAAAQGDGHGKLPDQARAGRDRLQQVRTPG